MSQKKANQFGKTVSYHCALCLFVAPSSTSVVSHYGTSHSSPNPDLACRYCGLQLQTSSTLYKHIERYCSVTPKQPQPETKKKHKKHKKKKKQKRSLTDDTSSQSFDESTPIDLTVATTTTTGCTLDKHNGILTGRELIVALGGVKVSEDMFTFGDHYIMALPNGTFGVLEKF